MYGDFHEAGPPEVRPGPFGLGVSASGGFDQLAFLFRFQTRPMGLKRVSGDIPGEDVGQRLHERPADQTGRDCGFSAARREAFPTGGVQPQG